MIRRANIGHTTLLVKTRPSERWISSTDTYKLHLALISAQKLEREREREREMTLIFNT